MPEMKPRAKRRQSKGLRWMHTTARLLQQGQCQRAVGPGLASRRWRQRRALGERLLEGEIQGWSIPLHSGERFWTGFRWGGVGFVLGRWLL